MKTIRECGFRYDLDLMTFMITRGRACLVSELKGKVRCPMCGSHDVAIGITLPGMTGASRERVSSRGAWFVSPSKQCYGIGCALFGSYERPGLWALGRLQAIASG